MNYAERLQQIIYHAADNELPILAPVVGRLLTRYRPETEEEQLQDDWGAMLTSNDIRHILEEVADVNINDISEVMAFAGFEVWTDGCMTKWRIRQLPPQEKVPVIDDRTPGQGGGAKTPD